MTVSLNKKESERFLRKMLETEQRPITKKEREMAEEIRKNFPEIGHRVIEKTDWIIPLFFIFLSWCFLMILNYFTAIYLYQDTKNTALIMCITAFVWIFWGLSILRNASWKPEKNISIEHYIIGDKKDEPRKKPFSLFQLWKRK